MTLAELELDKLAVDVLRQRRRDRIVRQMGAALCAAVALAVCAGAGAARLAAGTLDTSFGHHGVVQTTTDGFTGLALQPSGKIVAISDVALTRYDANGLLDKSFGRAGQVKLPMASSLDPPFVIEADGKIVVAGNRSKNLAVMRYTAGGVLDTSFGRGGQVETAITGNDFPVVLATEPNGMLVVVGWASKNCPASSKSQHCVLNDFVLTRYRANGALDTSFGKGGTVVTPMGRSYGDVTEPHALVIEPDGKIVVAAGGGAAPGFELVRYNPDGSLDASFGSGGIVSTVVGPFLESIPYALVLQPDGKLVAAGQSPRNCPDTDAVTCSMGEFGLARYNTDGSLDTSFGDGGIVTTRIHGDDGAQALVLQPDGKLIAAGSGDVPAYHSDPLANERNFAVVRYTADGSLDKTFGKSGIVTMGFKMKYAEAAALVRRRDGELVVGGYDELPGKNGSGPLVGAAVLVGLNG